MPALAGCSGSSDDGTESPTMQPTTTQPQTTTEEQSDEQDQAGDSTIDPRFGLTVTGSGSLPVEPDHTINLQIRERENIPIPEFYFDPVGLAVEPGDTVQFNMATPHHNVNAYHPAFGYNQRVPDGVPPFSSPILGAGESWLYTFETEGVHNIMCAPHELFGMVGTVVVGSATGPGANPVGDAPGGERARPPEYTAALVYEDPAMEPSTIVEQGSVAWSDLAAESKRPLLQPVEQQ
jgi:plastocyanin